MLEFYISRYYTILDIFAYFRIIKSGKPVYKNLYSLKDQDFYS
jgi:hypothetical protein